MARICHAGNTTTNVYTLPLRPDRFYSCKRLRPDPQTPMQHHGTSLECVELGFHRPRLQQVPVQVREVGGVLRWVGRDRRGRRHLRQFLVQVKCPHADPSAPGPSMKRKKWGWKTSVILPDTRMNKSLLRTPNADRMSTETRCGPKGHIGARSP